MAGAQVTPDVLLPLMLSSELLASVLEAAPDAIGIVDSAGMIVFASRQITSLCGCLPQEIVDGRIESLLPERYRAAHLAHRRGYTHNARARPMGVELDLFAQIGRASCRGRV